MAVGEGTRVKVTGCMPPGVGVTIGVRLAAVGGSEGVGVLIGSTGFGVGVGGGFGVSATGVVMACKVRANASPGGVPIAVGNGCGVVGGRVTVAGVSVAGMAVTGIDGGTAVPALSGSAVDRPKAAVGRSAITAETSRDPTAPVKSVSKSVRRSPRKANATAAATAIISAKAIKVPVLEWGLGGDDADRVFAGGGARP